MRPSQGKTGGIFATAPMTSVIAAVTFAAFLGSFLSGWVDILAYAGGFVPARVGDPAFLDQAGLPVAAVPVLLTPLTATFLHGGWAHVGFNLLTLVFCGRQVEMVLGPRLLLLLYFVGAYAAAAGQWALGPGVVLPMIGASGAISAIIGAYALLFSNQKVRAFGPIPANVVRMLWLGAGWVFIQALVGIAGSSSGGSIGDTSLSQIAVGAHVGGFLAGMILTRPLLKMHFGRGPRSVN
jgi:membrane associated rhomboid family serine protease